MPIRRVWGASCRSDALGNDGTVPSGVRDRPVACDSWGVDVDLADRRERFEEVAAGIMEPLRRFLARRTDPATADDVLAETLLVCWRRMAELPEDPLPWAYGVARQLPGQRPPRRAAPARGWPPGSRWWTRPPRRRPAPRRATAPDPALTEALARLRPEDAELLRLWAWEQLGAAEIAAVLDITANAASIRLHRARARAARRAAKDRRRCRT